MSEVHQLWPNDVGSRRSLAQGACPSAGSGGFRGQFSEKQAGTSCPVPSAHRAELPPHCSKLWKQYPETQARESTRGSAAGVIPRVNPKSSESQIHQEVA